MKLWKMFSTTPFSLKNNLKAQGRSDFSPFSWNSWTIWTLGKLSHLQCVCVSLIDLWEYFRTHFSYHLLYSIYFTIYHIHYFLSLLCSFQLKGFKTSRQSTSIFRLIFFAPFSSRNFVEFKNRSFDLFFHWKSIAMINPLRIH